jgi:hypothetical protein
MSKRVPPQPMRAGQLRRYALEEIEWLADDPMLKDWLPAVLQASGVTDLATLQLGVFRCVDACSGGDCDAPDGACEHCDNQRLWESLVGVPGWEPQCSCERKALLLWEPHEPTPELLERVRVALEE